MTSTKEYTVEEIEALPKLSDALDLLRSFRYDELKALGLVDVKTYGSEVEYEYLNPDMFYIRIDLSPANKIASNGARVQGDGPFYKGLPFSILQETVFSDNGGTPGVVLGSKKIGVFKTRLATLKSKELYNPKS